MSSEDTENDRLIDAKELKAIVPFSDMHLWRLEKAGRFPKRIKLGTSRVGWSLQEILEWVALKKSERS